MRRLVGYFCYYVGLCLLLCILGTFIIAMLLVGGFLLIAHGSGSGWTWIDRIVVLDMAAVPITALLLVFSYLRE